MSQRPPSLLSLVDLAAVLWVSTPFLLADRAAVTPAPSRPTKRARTSLIDRLGALASERGLAARSMVPTPVGNLAKASKSDGVRGRGAAAGGISFGATHAGVGGNHRGLGRGGRPGRAQCTKSTVHQPFSSIVTDNGVLCLS
jgi:hypothetical protein